MAVEGLLGDWVMKTLFGSCSSLGTGEFVRSGRGGENSERQESNGRRGHKRKVGDRGVPFERMRNEIINVWFTGTAVL